MPYFLSWTGCVYSTSYEYIAQVFLSSFNIDGAIAQAISFTNVTYYRFVISVIIALQSLNYCAMLLLVYCIVYLFALFHDLFALTNDVLY